MTARARIQPVGRSKVVQPVHAGKVLRVYVNEGAEVRAGDVLVELDPSLAVAEEARLMARLRALDDEISRLSAALDAVERSAVAKTRVSIELAMHRSNPQARAY